jgi:hypothetical protein
MLKGTETGQLSERSTPVYACNSSAARSASRRGVTLGALLVDYCTGCLQLLAVCCH